MMSCAQLCAMCGDYEKKYCDKKQIDKKYFYSCDPMIQMYLSFP